MAGPFRLSGPAIAHCGVNQLSKHSSNIFKSKRLTSTDVRSDCFIPFRASLYSNHGACTRTIEPLFPD
eukprot:12486996-Heterocapsa_arctica.AAC.1